MPSEKSKLEIFISLSNALSIWVTIISIFVGVYFAREEYLENKKDQRIDRVFDFAMRSESPMILGARNKVFGIWDNLKEELIQVSLSEGTKDMQQIENNLKTFTINIINKRMKYDVIVLIEFYNGLATCVGKNLCDENIAYEYFGRQMLSFRNLHYYFIVGLREIPIWKDPFYGKEMDDFVRDYKLYVYPYKEQVT